MLGIESERIPISLVEPEMAETPYLITFIGTSVVTANQYASDLATELRRLSPDITAKQHRLRDDTQDLGTAVAILSTGAVSTIAGGITAWLVRHSGVRLEITKDGTVLATNLDSHDAPELARALSNKG
jgi:hypothetical protein